MEVPNEGFSGQILGGLNYRLEKSEQENSESKMVLNEYEYNLAVLLENGSEIPPNEVTLNQVTTSQRNYSNYVEANLQNKVPTVIKNMKVSTIIKDSRGKTRFISSKEGVKMAPNSNFNYGIDLKKQPFKAGIYKLIMDVEADGQTYHFEKDYEVTRKEAKKLNDEALYIEENESNYLIYLIGVVVIILLIIGIKMLRQHKDN